MSRTDSARRWRTSSAVLLTTAFTLLTPALAQPAEASTMGQRAVAEASKHNGKPYSYGASGPSRFDCSGFTMYVFARLGKRLPHSSAAQYDAIRHIPKSSKAVGDLLFVRSSSGRINHVGINAGGGYWWVATSSGGDVMKQRIYTSSYVVGRVA